MVFSKMKKPLIILIFFFCSICGKAQILDAHKTLFGEESFFNDQFIKSNKIKIISGSWSSKKVKDIIRKKDLDFYYEFNKNGSLKQQYSTFLTQKTKKDTSVIAFEYDVDNKIITKRKTDNQGYFSYQYTYDANDNIIKETYYRDENNSPTKNEFELKKQYIITSDSFAYQKMNAFQTKKITYNNYRKSYKETFFYYDSLGYLIEIYSKYIIGNNKSKTTFSYNETGRLAEKQTTPNLIEGITKKEVFFYDEIGNLIEIKTYENEVYKTSTQFMYDGKMLLTAQLTKEIATEFITILQFDYQFFDE